jgi:hypothetical protein
MDISESRFMEHLATDSSLSLREFCARMQRQFGLPDFEFDAENETEWGLVVRESVEYNVSRPYQRGTLQAWDGSVPVGCNFGVTLRVSDQCPASHDAAWSLSNLVAPVAQGLADVLEQSVHHHRTWVKDGASIARKQVFRPKANRAGTDTV